jgi:hypothetical protein
MGNFYTNYTLRGPSQQSVAEALAGRSAIVTPAQDGCVVIFDEESDDQNQEIIAELAARLSGKFRCPLLAVLNHDDSIFWYQLYLDGELVDEYDSCPNYFSETDGENSLPSGGDAQKLCRAFGANTVAKVEGILRKSAGDDDGYIFAFERHDDLAAALGIPSFGVGTGFSHFSIEEIPDELAEADLVRTKDLIPSEPLDSVPRKAVPGYYKVSFRAAPGLTKSIPSVWMPGLWAELECSERDLSEGFRLASAPHREKFKQLGFAEQGFKKLSRILNPNHRDDGGINYLDRSRSQFGQLIYNKSYFPSLKAEKVGVRIVFTAVFQHELLSCTNNPKSHIEPLPNHTVIRIESNDVALIHGKFVQLLSQKREEPRRFPDLPSLQAWYDSNALAKFENCVRRGLWVRMSDYEVAVAQRKIPPPLPNT